MRDQPQLHDLTVRTGGAHRWLAVAALVSAVVLTAALLISVRDEPDVPVQQVPQPTLSFDPTSSAPVWPSPADVGFDADLAEPGRAAIAYLYERTKGPLGGGIVLDETQVDPGAGRATVSWFRPDGGNLRATSGTAYLRRVFTDPARWLVVGSIDDELVFSGVSYRDDRLQFSVTASVAVPSVQISVVVNGQSIGLGGPELTPPDAVVDPEFGQGFSLRPGEPQAVDTAVPMPVDGAPVVRVRQVEAAFAAVAAFAVQPEGGPPGGRLVTAGLFANKTWRLWATDRADGMDEGPCVLLTVAAKTVSGPTCGIGPGDPTDRQYFGQIGPVAQELEQTLIFGVVEAEVDTVDVMHVPDDGQQVKRGRIRCILTGRGCSRLGSLSSVPRCRSGSPMATSRSAIASRCGSTAR